jgi:two-component system, NtrC family, sensor histidine kinase KinB
MKSFFNSLRSKILTGYFVVIFIMIFVMFWSLYNFNLLNESFKSIIVQNYSSIVAADNMVKELDNQLNGLYLIINEKDFNSGNKLFEESKQNFFYWFDKARDAAYTKQEIVLLDSMNDEYTNFLEKIGPLLSRDSGSKEQTEIKNFYFANIFISKIKNDCYALFNINHSFISSTNDRVKSITRDTAFTILFLIILGSILSLIFGTRFSRYIVKPVKELTQSVQLISTGNFAQRIETESSDEIGILAGEFNSMAEMLQKYEELNINKILYEKKKSEIVIESINDPVLIVDDSKNIILANKAFYFEFGKGLTNLIKLEDIINDRKVFENIENMIVSNGNEMKEERYIYIDETRKSRYYNLKYSLINLPETNSKAVLMVFNDITKYEELDRLKSEFIAKVSHELKTPLTSIGMAVGILGDNVLGPISVKQKQLINSMQEDYSRLNKLVKEILELSKIESGGIKLDLKPVYVADIVNNVLKYFSLVCKEKEINLVFNKGNTYSKIVVDFEYFSRALSNFISNSIKYTAKKGEIKVSTKEVNSDIIIEISDTGKGIEPQYIDKIFDKFVQVNENSSGSVGLGLSIAKEIIDLHEGTIKVWSEINKGTKFEITIPALKDEQV